MKKSGRLGLLVILMCVAGLACMSSKDIIKDNLRRGKDEFRRGNVLEAYSILRKPVMQEIKKRPEYSNLLKKVTVAAEYLVDKWLEKGDFWMQQGDLSKAYLYYADLAEKLPRQDSLRRKVIHRAHLLGERLRYLKKGISDLLKKGKRDFIAGRYKRARNKLLEARWLALENNLPFSIADEGLIEECNRRAPSEFDLALQDIEGISRINDIPKPADKSPVHDEKKSIRKGRHSPSGKHVPRAVRALNPRVERMLENAAGHLRNKRYLKAIVILNKILNIEPDNERALTTLEKLDSIRRQLVSNLMKKANTYFVREELEKAVPFYQQVLKIDPGNIRAKEGLQMYRRLEELKERQH